MIKLGFADKMFLTKFLIPKLPIKDGEIDYYFQCPMCQDKIWEEKVKYSERKVWLDDLEATEELLKNHWFNCTGLYLFVWTGEDPFEPDEVSVFDKVITGSYNSFKKSFYQSCVDFFSSFHEDFVPKSLDEIEVSEKEITIESQKIKVIIFSYGVCGGLNTGFSYIIRKI